MVDVTGLISDKLEHLTTYWLWSPEDCREYFKRSTTKRTIKLSFYSAITTLQLEMKTQFLIYLIYLITGLESQYIYWKVKKMIFLFIVRIVSNISTLTVQHLDSQRKFCLFHFQIWFSDKFSVINIHTSAFVCPTPVNQI